MIFGLDQHLIYERRYEIEKEDMRDLPIAVVFEDYRIEESIYPLVSSMPEAREKAYLPDFDLEDLGSDQSEKHEHRNEKYDDCHR